MMGEASHPTLPLDRGEKGRNVQSEGGHQPGAPGRDRKAGGISGRSSDERFQELKAAIEGWHKTVREGRN